MAFKNHDSDKFIMVLMTSPQEKEAREIAQALLHRRQAACVGIFPAGESFFWWEGKIDRAREFLLIAKSRKDMLGELIETVKAIHAYDVPEIVALPIVGGNPEYLNWLGKELKP